MSDHLGIHARIVAFAFLIAAAGCSSGGQPGGESLDVGIDESSIADPLPPEGDVAALTPTSTQQSGSASPSDEAGSGPEVDPCGGVVETMLGEPVISTANPDLPWLEVSPFHSVAVLADGRLVATGKKSFSVWSLDAPSEPEVIDDNKAFHSIVEMSDGRLLTGGANPVSSVRIYEPEGLDEVPVKYRGHERVNVVAIELADGLVASAGGDEVHIWNPAAIGGGIFNEVVEVQLVYSGHVGQRFRKVESLLELPDGRIASAAGDEVHVWDRSSPESPDVIYSGHSTGSPNVKVVHLGLTDDGRVISVAGIEVHIWSPDDPSLEAMAYRCNSGVWKAFAISDGRIVSLGRSGVHVWDPSSGSQTQVFVRDDERIDGRGFVDGFVDGVDLGDGRIVVAIHDELHVIDLADAAS